MNLMMDQQLITSKTEGKYNEDVMFFFFAIQISTSVRRIATFARRVARSVLTCKDRLVVRTVTKTPSWERRSPALLVTNSTRKFKLAKVTATVQTSTRNFSLIFNPTFQTQVPTSRRQFGSLQTQLKFNQSY